MAKIFYVFLLMLPVSSICSAQNTSRKVREYCDSLIKIRNADVYHIETDQFGGFAEGYYVNDSLVRITHVIAHVSIYQDDYYFLSGELVLVRSLKTIPAYYPNDPNKMKTKFEQYVYFRNDNIIKIETTGEKPRAKRKEMQKHVLENVVSYKYHLELKKKGIEAAR